MRKPIDEARMLCDALFSELGTAGITRGEVPGIDGRDAIEEMFEKGLPSWTENEWPGFYMKHLMQELSIKEYPDVFEHLKEYKGKLIERCGQGKNWWNLRSCDYYDEVQSPKIIWPAINNQCNFYLDESGKLFMLNNNYFMNHSQ